MNNFLIANYIKSAWRNILRHKLFSIINILGLAIGLAAVMLIALYVRYETSYDSFWKNADNIYRTHLSYNFPNRDPLDTVLSVGAMRDTFYKDIPEIDKISRVRRFYVTITNGEKITSEPVYLVDPEYWDIFNFKLLHGDIESNNARQNGIVLTKSRAEKIFGNEEALEKTLSLDYKFFKRDYIVTAIIEDLPKNSQISTDAIVPLNDNDWKNIPEFNTWARPFYHLYFTLKNNTSITQVNKKLSKAVSRNAVFNNSLNISINITSMNIKDLHLNAKGIGNHKPFGDKTSVNLYSVVGLFILLIATFNYINLSTARASNRAKEVSLRKVSGAERKALIIQFISESVLYAILALFISFVSVEIITPFFINFIGLPLKINYSTETFIFAFIITIIVGILGGVYPALVLSKFNPSVILKASHSGESNVASLTRKVLVIFQFTISISLFVATAAVYYQMHHINNKELGYSKENLLYLDNVGREAARDNMTPFINALKETPGIINVGKSGIKIGRNDKGFMQLKTPEMPNGQTITSLSLPIDHEFIKTIKNKIIAGRSYDESRDQANNSNSINPIIINQEAITKLGFNSAKEAIGRTIYHRNSERPYEIIGVTENMNLFNLKETIEPLAFMINPDTYAALYIRYSGNISETLITLENIWNKHIPDVEFNPVIIEDALMEQYLQEQTQMTMFAAFSGLAIFIACLGLFGLASFTAERRTKEIGIRKVFGAEVWQIVKMLVFQFSKPVLIANIIAWPIAYLAMSRWLESFVYRIDDMVIIALCLIAGLTALLIAWATVAGNSYAVARQNPIKALRYE